MSEDPSETPSPEAASFALEVPARLAGRRFDQALAELLPQYSRSRLSAWIRSGRATLSGRAARPRDIVSGGEPVRVDAVVEPEQRFEAEAIPIEVLHRDRDVLVINKPPGLVVHPGAGNPGGTLQNALLALDPGLARVPRAGIVHRLDKDTSGALVIARTLAAHTKLVALLAERDVHRRYVALVQGAMIAGSTVRAAIGRHPRDRLKMAVREDGREAVTHDRVRERFRAHTLLQVELETGRTHQIRVHLAHVRHPIVGDPLYNSGLKLPKAAGAELVEGLRAFNRQALHAELLQFAHPRTGGEVSVEAPMPADFTALLALLRADATRAS
jgi:23S rRNA pseudouridine1911/1915/1917 synthase